MTATDADPAALAAVFSPRRVAVVGASARPGTIGRLLWDNLADFPGEVVPVCPAERIDGRRAYPDLRDVPGPIDLAVVATPAAAVPEVLRAAGDAGVTAAVVLSAGFAETGPDGAARQQEALEAARAGGVRLVGPNCFGVQNADLPLNASIAAGTPGGGGGVSIVTQSGSYGMAMHTLARQEAMRVAKVYAAGNKADVTDAEVLAYLRDDPATKVICLLLESISDGRRFFEQARLTTSVKPVLAVVSGRSRAGRRAAESHTASLASDDAVLDAALRQAGVVRVRTGLQLLDAGRALTSQPAPRGNRIAIVTNSGGTGVELADLLADEDLTVPELSPALQDKLRPVLPGYASARNPVDITPVWRRFPELYPAVTDMLARSGEVDVVVPVLLQRAASAEVAHAVREVAAALRRDDVPVPVHVCWVAPREAREHADDLQRHDVPCFEWPERTARAIGAAVRAGTAVRAGAAADSEGAASADRRRGGQRPVTAAPVIEPNMRGWLSPLVARDLLAGAGLPVVETACCRDVDEAVAAGEAFGYPVVAKVDHPDLLHKSDIGGVRTSLADAAALRAAAADLSTLAEGARLLVQPQRRGVEVVVGGIRDAAFGPVVMVGLGGVLVETRRDVAFAVAPVDAGQGAALLRSLRGAAILDGVRGAPPVDVAALAATVTAVGDLMVAVPRIAELDLNPVLAGPDGCVAVDWRVRVEL